MRKQVFGWVRRVRMWPVVMTDRLSVPVSVSYTDQNLVRQGAHFHSRSLEIQWDERGSYIFLSFPPFHRSFQQLVSPYDLYRTDKQSHGKPISLSKPTWRTQVWPTASLVLPKPCRVSQYHLRNRKLWPYLFTSNCLGFIFSFPYTDPMLKHMCRHTHWQAEKQAGYSEHFMWHLYRIKYLNSSINLAVLALNCITCTCNSWKKKCLTTLQTCLPSFPTLQSLVS